MAGYMLHPVEYILIPPVLVKTEEKDRRCPARGGRLGQNRHGRSLKGLMHRGRHITVFHDGFIKRYGRKVMYDVTKEHIFLLFALVLAALIVYFGSMYYGLLYGLLAGLFAFFFLIGARFYVAETDEERLLGSFIMAAGIGFYVAMMLGFSAGIGAFLLSLVVLLAYILLSE